jgi:predicted nucleotidyltransferase component of viral defense system
VFKTHSLLPETQAVFNAMAGSELTEGFLLIGGTAMALHIAHRLSSDLDFVFCQPDGKLPTGRIDSLIMQLRNQGHKATLITDSSQTAAFAVNTGQRLSDYVRDYSLDGVKVTFFSASPSAKPRRFEFWRTCARDFQAGCAFAVLSLDAMKAAKTLVLQDRVRSRDLFDLMVLMRDHGYTLEALFDTVARLADDTQDGENERLVLRGLIPLDPRDEGLQAVGVTLAMSDIYSFFNTRLTDYEAAIHARHVMAAKAARQGAAPPDDAG